MKLELYNEGKIALAKANVEAVYSLQTIKAVEVVKHAVKAYKAPRLKEKAYKFKVGDTVRTTSGPYDPSRCSELDIVATITKIEKAFSPGGSGCNEMVEFDCNLTPRYIDCIELVEEAV